jgi:UDP-N-acetylmuramate: L-alanyl-gamma-D-glutamyl-meso-diaminopimelate ligase
MPKDFFSVDAITSLSAVPEGSKIHIIGVCGVAMAQLAVALAERGYVVSGSDKDFYEPMKSLLEGSSVETLRSYREENVPLDAKLVVIGNAISYGNPEVDVVERENLPYTCFPKLLQETAIAERHSIVVAGTHGKSTTTALTAYMLSETGQSPSYFVGGIAQSLPKSLCVGAGQVSVVEGDEYDSAFFAKVPKFTFYTPDTAIINAIEFDHADIYPDIEAIEAQFEELVRLLGAGGTAICCIDFPRVKELTQQWRKRYGCSFITFGVDADADCRIVERSSRGIAQRVTVEGGLFGAGYTLEIPMLGEYNARNAVAALLAVCEQKGVSLESACEALQGFKSVKRRQEIRGRKNGVVIIEDFAHHPTAVDQTMAGMREAFPEARLWAVFEPRSNTSRRTVFQQAYIDAFARADRVVLRDVQARAIDEGLELIEVSALSDAITASGVPSECFDNVEAIREYLWNSLEQDGSDDVVKDVVVVMSNGSFDGLPQMLADDCMG